MFERPGMTTVSATSRIDIVIQYFWFPMNS